MEDLGRARYRQVQPGTVLKVPSCAIFSKDIKDFKDIKYNTERPQKGSQKSVIKVFPKCVPKSLKYVITPNTEAIFLARKSEIRDYASYGGKFFWKNLKLVITAGLKFFLAK